MCSTDEFFKSAAILNPAKGAAPTMWIHPSLHECSYDPGITPPGIDCMVTGLVYRVSPSTLSVQECSSTEFLLTGTWSSESEGGFGAVVALWEGLVMALATNECYIQNNVACCSASNYTPPAATIFHYPFAPIFPGLWQPKPMCFE